MPGRHVGEEVPEPVGQQDLADDPAAGPPGRRPRQASHAADRWAEAIQRHPAGAVPGHRGEDVAGVECPADAPAARPVVARHRQRHRARAGPRGAEAQEPVVRTHEDVTVGADGQRTSRPAHPGIDHGQVNGPRREEAVGGLQRDGAAPDVLRRNRVGEVHDPGRRVDRQDHALDDPDVGVLDTEVGQQRDDPARPPPPPTSPRVSRAMPDHRPHVWSAPGAGFARASEGGHRGGLPRPRPRTQRSRWTTYSPIRPSSSRASEGGNRSRRAVASAA